MRNTSIWFKVMAFASSAIWIYFVVFSIWGDVTLQGIQIQNPLLKMVTTFFTLLIISAMFMLFGFVGKLGLFPVYVIFIAIFNRNKFAQLKKFGLRMVLAFGVWFIFAAITALLVDADVVAEKYNGDRWHIFLNNFVIAIPVSFGMFIAGYFGKFLLSPVKYIYQELADS